MKKLTLININVVVAFILFDLLLNYLDKWADKYSLGAEMMLGMLTPLLFGIFIILAFCLIVFSIIKCVVKKDAKQLVQNVVLVVPAISYIFLSNSNSFWNRLVTYYLNF